MPNLTRDQFQVVSKYLRARYSHWDKPDRKRQRKRIIKALKKESPERVEQYVREAEEALARSGL